MKFVRDFLVHYFSRLRIVRMVTPPRLRSPGTTFSPHLIFSLTWPSYLEDGCSKRLSFENLKQSSFHKLLILYSDRSTTYAKCFGDVPLGVIAQPPLVHPSISKQPYQPGHRADLCSQKPKQQVAVHLSSFSYTHSFVIPRSRSADLSGPSPSDCSPRFQLPRRHSTCVGRQPLPHYRVVRNGLPCGHSANVVQIAGQ